MGKSAYRHDYNKLVMTKIEVLVNKGFVTEEVANKYKDALELFYTAIAPQLNKEQNICPVPKNVFRALNECPKPKVVILGQDPYHDGSATGLAFDNLRTENVKKLSPSLVNILKEMIKDGNAKYIPTPTVLGHLPSQGVLLLNTALTVLEGKDNAGCHIAMWRPFIELVIKKICEEDNVVWILWGAHAKSYKKYITNETHCIIEGGHPSPLNRNKDFTGGKYFSRTNEFLKSTNQTEIKW